MADRAEIAKEKALDFYIKYSEATSAEKVAMRQDAKLAVAMVSAIGRLRATERAADHTQFEVIRAISENREDAQKYIAVSLPHLNPIFHIQNKPEKTKKK